MTGTGTNTTTNATDAFREVTDDQVAEYRDHGWVELPGFLQPSLATELRYWFEERMGITAATMTERGPNLGMSGTFRMYTGASREDEFVRGIVQSTSIARASCRLMGVDSVRFQVDQALPKVPSTDGGTDTAWHQDLPHLPYDRKGSHNFWIALADVTPDMGILRFLDGSHKVGPLGRSLRWKGDPNLTVAYPSLLDEFTVVSPAALKAGDAVVFDGLTVHGAGENRGTGPRWGYQIGYMPGRALYTGAAHHLTDGMDLKPDAEFDHPMFPLFKLDSGWSEA